MTIEKKREIIADYCKTQATCAMCPLNGHKDENGICYTNVNDNLIKRNYDILQSAFVFPEPSEIKRHEDICRELNVLYARKNADYGDSFHKTYIEEGMAMARIRLSDKLERFKRLTRSDEQNVQDESVRDTLIDLANYAIMTVMEMDGEKE